MAKRRTSQSPNMGCLKVVAGFVALVVALEVLKSIWIAAEHNPATAGLVVFLLAAGAGLTGVFWWRHRQNELAAAAARRAAAEVERQRVAQIRFVQSQEIARYHVMGAKEFEQALAFLCERDGCTNVRVVGGANDLGADVIATTPDGRVLVLQAKRYGQGRTVGSQAVQVVNGTYRHEHGADLAAIVTTAVFTKPARDYAARTGIRLFDEQALAAWASRTGPAPWHEGQML